MAGGLIAAAVCSHSPRMGIEEGAPPFIRGLIEGERELGAVMREDKPDLFVLVSAHWVSTFEWFVTGHRIHQGMCVADEAPDLVPGLPYRRYGDPDYAAALAERLRSHDIPCKVNDNPNYTWDYGSFVPLKYLDPDGEVPVVTLPTVICSEIEECVTVGRLAHETAKTLGRRAIFLASCALSHLVVRGPERWPTPEHQALDQRLIDLMVAGDTKTLVDWVATYAKDAKAEMGGRTIATLIGALAALADEHGGKVSGRQYGPYAQSSASGNANVYVTPLAA